MCRQLRKTSWLHLAAPTHSSRVGIIDEVIIELLRLRTWNCTWELMYMTEQLASWSMLASTCRTQFNGMHQALIHWPYWDSVSPCFHNNMKITQILLVQSEVLYCDIRPLNDSEDVMCFTAELFLSSEKPLISDTVQRRPLPRQKFISAWLVFGVACMKNSLRYFAHPSDYTLNFTGSKPAKLCIDFRPHRLWGALWFEMKQHTWYLNIEQRWLSYVHADISSILCTPNF